MIKNYVIRPVLSRKSNKIGDVTLQIYMKNSLGLLVIKIIVQTPLGYNIKQYYGIRVSKSIKYVFQKLACSGESPCSRLRPKGCAEDLQEMTDVMISAFPASTPRKFRLSMDKPSNS